MQRRQPINEIEERLRVLRLPEGAIERHINRLRQLRYIPGKKLIPDEIRVSLIRDRQPGRFPRYRWKRVIEGS